MNRPLTHQQQTVYDFIRDKIISRGYGPTVREIGEHMNIKSPNGVMCHLRALERKGMITRTANKSRAIELTESISQLLGASLTLRGSISNGAYLLDAEGAEQIDISQFAHAGERYAIRVRDDSLSDSQIRSGDVMIVQKQSVAQHGQLALVRTGDSETCLRLWIHEGGRIRLQPVHRMKPPTIVDRAEVVGVVVGIMRDLSRSGHPPPSVPAVANDA